MRVRTRHVQLLVLLATAVSFARAQETLPPPGPTVKLADLEAEAERKHPAIRAAARTVEATRARVPQARAWPDPQLIISYMGDPAPFKTQANDPSSYRQFGVMQEIPFPGKRELRGRIAAKAVDAEQWNYEAVRRRVRAEVRLAFYELWAADQALEITQKNKELLEKLARIAEEKYRVGQGILQDVLRAQVEVTRVVERLTVLRLRRQTLEAQLNSLLLRPPDAPMAPLEPVAKTVLNYSLEELVARGIENDPEIRGQEQRIEQNQYAIQLARKEYSPDLSVGWDYQNRPGMPEMYGLRFTVSLPVFYRSKQRQAVNEAAADLASARETREAIRTRTLFRVKEQYLLARASEELLTLYAEGIGPQAALALDSALAAYQVGKVDFLSVITNFLTLLDAENRYYEELASYQKALARLEEITAVSFGKRG